MPGPISVVVAAEELEPGGVFVYTEALVQGLLQVHHGVAVVTRGGSLAGNLAARGALVIEERSLGRLWGGASALRRSVAALQGLSPQIVHAVSPAAQELGVALARRLGGCPAVMTVQRFHGKPGPVAVDRACAGVIAVSEPLRERLVNEVRCPKELISVVPEGVDLARYRVPPERPDRSIPVLGSVGRLVPERGHEYLIRAAEIILRAGFDAEYIIAGDGPGRERLLSMASAALLRERLTISRGAADYSLVLPEMDIFVAPSTSEGLGIHIMEAMACGRPVVASSVGGILGVVKDGKGGFLVPPRDPAAIANAAITLLKDPLLRVAMGAYSRQQAEAEFPMKRMIEGTEAVYRRVLEEAPKGKSSPRRP